MKNALDAGFAVSFGGTPERYFSAPGRTEIGGNHTDHQRGRVLAGAVNLDTVAAVRPNGTKIIRIQSKGYPMSVVDLENLAPVAEDSALETYKNLPVEGHLKASDPENQALTFALIRQPKRGAVTIREDGSFTYEPKKNKVGVDSFTYTAADPSGNVSREATVIVTILKPSQAQQYTDTIGQSCRFAAEWMKNTGIFIAEQVSGANCFQPDKTVSRSEFLTMLVSALELDTTDVETAAVEDAPAWFRPYLAAAMRCGLTAGLEDGKTDEAISGAEAAVMIQNALDLPLAEDTDAVASLAENGFTLTAEAPLTRACAAEALYRMSQLAREAPGTQVFDPVH